MIKIGETIGNYEIIDFLGEGGMGMVLKAVDKTSGQLYAFKYCKESDEKSIRRFKREVRVAAETKHSNIIEIIEYNLDNEPPYFIMPLAKGSVHDAIKNLIGDFSKVILVFEQMCKGVSALHLSGKFHRDIKPRNALILENGTVVIADFGLAKFETKDSSTLTSSNKFIGTYGYHAPEQFDGRVSDARTDVFQLGKSLYEMFTSDYPYLINLKKIPASLGYIIQKATSADPEDRYQTVSELLQAVKGYEKSLNPKANPKDALENKLLEIQKLANDGTYSEELCFELLDLLGNNYEDTKLFIDSFDKIPNQILKVFSNQLEKRFSPILEEYTRRLETYFKETYVDFSYAEVVASKMSAIFSSTKNIHFKGLALKNTLRAAIWCNRFNAMDTFSHLLQLVKSDEDAGYIAQILLDEIDLYSNVADQVDDNELHPTIIEAKNKAIEYIEEKEKKEIEQNAEFLKNLFK